MALLAGDIRFARSVNMSDVPEGGGPPSAQLLNSGRSNEVFPDISEETRTVGRVEIYQIFSVLRNSDSTPLLGGNVILAEPPTDPNVSITMLSLKNPFATRADIASRIESGMSPGSEWNGYLLENHFTTMRSLTLLQRPGVTPPVVGRTYLLIYNEGHPSERRQRVRIKSTDTIQRIFTEVMDKGNVDFLAQVSTCEIFDGLSHDFPGSPPISTFARSSTKSLIRETVYSDSGMFYSATPLAQATAINDVWLKVASIYTQVVPNSRTEVVAIDQYPAARRTLVLAESPRRVEVGITPHTQRIRIAEENAGTIYVALLKPLPAAGTVFVDFWALGQRYTLSDDGTGRMVGQGSGSVNYLTGALQLTLKSLPDIGSPITISHGENMAYTNRSGQAGYRAPEFAWAMPHQGIKPSSVAITWLSGGIIKTVTDNGSGALSGTGGVGEIDYATGKIYLRPTAMIDAGGEFRTGYEYTSTRTENFAGIAPDSGGFATLMLAEVPAGKSITARWITTRTVTASSGTSEIVSSSEVTVPQVVDMQQATRRGDFFEASTRHALPGALIAFRGELGLPQIAGTYTWELADANTPALNLILQGGATSGTFEMTPKQVSRADGFPGVEDDPTGICVGTFQIVIADTCPDVVFNVLIKNQALTTVTMVPGIAVDAVGDKPAPPWPITPPPPVITSREPVGQLNAGALPLMKLGGWTVDTGARIFVSVPRTRLAPGSIYADPDGMGYDLPDVDSANVYGDTSVRWTESDLTAGFKTIQSVAGVATKYYLWK